ncbi:MAG: DNA repair protein RecO [bacterium]|nr:DNA repair protein RecO [bacterium]
MLAKCRGIVLSTVPYSESSVVLKCYTDQYGLQSYMVSGLRGKKAAIKPSHLLPLSLLELEVYHQQSKNLQRIKELKSVPILNQLHFDLTKQTMALFMAELLGKSLRDDNQRDPQLFEFVFNSVQIVDLFSGSLGNFPVFFMLKLSKYLGFFPKQNYSENCADFSLAEGLFMKDAPNTIDYCKHDLSRALFLFTEMSFENFDTLKFSAATRHILLQKMVRYYQLHLMMFGELKSPAVLHEILKD